VKSRLYVFFFLFFFSFLKFPPSFSSWVWQDDDSGNDDGNGSGKDGRGGIKGKIILKDDKCTLFLGDF